MVGLLKPLLGSSELIHFIHLLLLLFMYFVGCGRGISSRYFYDMGAKASELWEKWTWRI